MINKLDLNQFKRIVNVVVKINDDDVIKFLYDIYEISIDSIDDLTTNNIINAAFINHTELIFYIVGEYVYSVSKRNEEEIKKFIQDENILTSIASVATDKYLTLSLFRYKERKLGNTFLPPISSLNLYLNFILNILQNYHKNDPRSTLIVDLLTKSISIARCISSLLVDGYETEAFSNWRTLHECECTLVLLAKHYKEVIPAYLKHMSYAMIFKKGHSDTPEEEAIFNQLKEEMKSYNLKSKDMKKFIEYGWLYSIEEARNDESFKLNFRDGLEKLAGLSSYNERYELSSEIIHSTPMLIYSSKEYYYYLTLLSLYESFFRLEKVFMALLASSVSKEDMDKYHALKSVYYVQLVNIHKIELEAFNAWKRKIGNKKP